MRPRAFAELWDWAVAEAISSSLDAPDRLHARHPYPEKDSDLPQTPWAIARPPVQRSKSAAIVGRPFTRAFIRYLDGGKAMTPIRRALIDMVATRHRQRTLGERIIWGLVEAGHYDQTMLRGIFGCSWATFRAAALPALAHLYEKTQREIAMEPKRLALTAEPASGNVRASDHRARAPQAGPRRRLRPGRERLAS